MEQSFKGILYPARLPTFHRVPAPPAIADWVQWFWIPEWNIEPGRTSRQHLIAFPNSNLVVEQDGVALSGPSTRASHRDLSGQGWAVGALLRPAAVPLFSSDPASLRDREVAFPADDLHGPVSAAMTAGAASDAGTHREQAVHAFVGWLAALAGPAASAEALLANRLLAVIDREPDLTRIEDVANVLAVSPRTLQRLAKKYIGLGPAELIRRRRLQAAAETTRLDPAVDLSALAAKLGYADHAHLTHDFQKYLGFTPTTYRRAVGDSATGRPAPE